jgi:hypothetical protein
MTECILGTSSSRRTTITPQRRVTQGEGPQEPSPLVLGPSRPQQALRCRSRLSLSVIRAWGVPYNCETLTTARKRRSHHLEEN